jgi:ferredoxin
MCEFCTTHGDGQVWYRNARNYAEDLLADLRRRKFIADFLGSTMAEGIQVVGRLEAIYRKKGALPERVVRGVVDRAREEHFGQVVTLEDVRAIVGGAAQVVRLPCACRWVAEHREARWCYSVSYSADPWFRGLDLSLFGEPPTAGLEVVTREEAIAQMAALEERGAVHTIWTMVTPFIGAICNCTPKECLGLRNLAIGLKTMAPGEQTAFVDPLACSGCGVCTERCHFGAVALRDESGRAIARVDGARCYGCALCANACPEGAILMRTRGGDSLLAIAPVGRSPDPG